MIDLLDVLQLMLFATACAWLWRGHGIRERALALAKQHCAKLDVELLDGNVAFRRLALLRDSRGQRRVARIYGFEFTVTGEQRLSGSISMYGRQLGAIELAAQHQRERAGPECGCQRARQRRHVGRHLVELLDRRNMHDQRVVGGPALGVKDPRHCGGIERVRTQAVDRLGWEGDQTAAPQCGRRQRDRVRRWCERIDQHRYG